MTTYLVNQLKEECDLKIQNSSPNRVKWVLVAIGIALIVLETGCLLASLAFSNLLLGQMGLYLIPASVLCFCLIPLFAPTDYEYVKGLIDRELVEFAEREDREELGIVHQGKIHLNPDNIALYHAIHQMATKRKAEEDASKNNSKA